MKPLAEPPADTKPNLAAARAASETRLTTRPPPGFSKLKSPPGVFRCFMSAKSNGAGADKRSNDRLWQLYQLAFQRLTDRHVCLPPHLYDEAGDREWESAENIAHHALTLAVAAAAKWETRLRATETETSYEHPKLK